MSSGRTQSQLCTVTPITSCVQCHISFRLFTFVSCHVYFILLIEVSCNIYIYIYIYKNLPLDVIVRLPHRRNGDSQGQETVLAPPADKQTRNYDTDCSNHHPSLSTLRPKGLSRSKMK